MLLNRFANRAFAALSIAIFILASTAAGQVTPDPPASPPASANARPSPTPTSADDPDDAATKKDQKKEKRGSWILAPVPIFSPAVGVGIVPVVGYIFNFSKKDKLSPPSTVGFVGGITNNGSRFGAIGGRLYFAENKYEAAFAVVKLRVIVDFYGVGRVPGEDAVFIPLKTTGNVYFGEFLRNVGKDIFVGIRYQYRRLNFGIDGEAPKGGFEIPPLDLRSTSAALGFKVKRDLRDSTFYPTRGSLFETKGDFFSQALGSNRQYQTYTIAYNGYRSFNDKRVLAYRAMGCSANQDVPFYDLCLFGFNNDLRGYTAGQFQNRRMFATQAELRQVIKGRFGMVVFGGVGGVASGWDEFRFNRLLPAAGVGFRFNLNKKNHVNYRVDWAIGRQGSTLIIGVGEAF